MNFAHQIRVIFNVTHRYGFESTQENEDTVMLTEKRIAAYADFQHCPHNVARRILVRQELALRNPRSQIVIKNLQEE